MVSWSAGKKIDRETAPDFYDRFLMYELFTDKGDEGKGENWSVESGAEASEGNSNFAAKKTDFK